MRICVVIGLLLGILGIAAEARADWQEQNVGQSPDARSDHTILDINGNLYILRSFFRPQHRQRHRTQLRSKGNNFSSCI